MVELNIKGNRRGILPEEIVTNGFGTQGSKGSLCPERICKNIHPSDYQSYLTINRLEANAGQGRTCGQELPTIPPWLCIPEAIDFMALWWNYWENFREYNRTLSFRKKFVCKKLNAALLRILRSAAFYDSTSNTIQNNRNILSLHPSLSGTLFYLSMEFKFPFTCGLKRHPKYGSGFRQALQFTRTNAVPAGAIEEIFRENKIWKFKK